LAILEAVVIGVVVVLVLADSSVKVKQIHGGKALRIVFKGPYGGLPKDYPKLEAFMAARGYEPAGPSWNEYVSDPGTTPEAELTTNFYPPVK
jgi:effector-binding domain-containing protein